MTIHFTGNEVQTVTHALRVAAERFEADALFSRTINQSGMAEQFDRQATESRALADKIDEAV